MAKVVPRPQLTWAERLYFIEIFKGLKLTIGHALRSFLDPGRLPTISYPEVQPDLPQDYRSRHRLMKQSCQSACSGAGRDRPAARECHRRLRSQTHRRPRTRRRW